MTLLCCFSYNFKFLLVHIYFEYHIASIYIKKKAEVIPTVELTTGVQSGYEKAAALKYVWAHLTVSLLFFCE